MFRIYIKIICFNSSVIIYEFHEPLLEILYFENLTAVSRKNTHFIQRINFSTKNSWHIDEIFLNIHI